MLSSNTSVCTVGLLLLFVCFLWKFILSSCLEWFYRSFVKVIKRFFFVCFLIKSIITRLKTHTQTTKKKKNHPCHWHKSKKTEGGLLLQKDTVFSLQKLVNILWRSYQNKGNAEEIFVVLLPEGTAEAPVLAQVFDQSSPPATKLLPKHCFMKQSEA